MDQFFSAEPGAARAWTDDGTLTRDGPADGGRSLVLPNLHGDNVALGSLASNATGLTSTNGYTEFGLRRAAGSWAWGWLENKLGGDGLFNGSGGIIDMGVRLYNPATGRFLQTDPIPGGSANAYDYASQDPINNFDLNGRMCFGPSWTCDPWGALMHHAKKTAKHVYQHATLSGGGCIVICIGATFQNGTLSGSLGGIGLLEFGPAIGWNSAKPSETERGSVFACGAYIVSICGGGGNRHRESGKNAYFYGSVGTGFGGAAGAQYTIASHRFRWLEL